MGDTDVLIIGGGPTGLMLALELSLQNVSYRIIDSAPQRSDKSRGMVVHSRTMELLARHGIMDELQGLGYTLKASRIFVNKKFVFEMDIKDLDYGDTQFGAPLMISQAETEHVLDKALEKYGKKVERPVKAERVEQDDEGVTAWLCNPDGTEEKIRCKYIVGCDGAHSVVRKAAGQKFDGGTYPQDFILADVHLKVSIPSLYIASLILQYWASPAGFHSFRFLISG